ncbi:hypothetical protein [Roseibium sp. SCP14]|uniref:hypothetical protein n=1 Tax=Roseibium sp. SCP14 TaxID=3141375 RepID=UPI003337D8CE
MSKRIRDDFTIDMFTGWTPPRVSVGFEPGTISGNRLASRISRAIATAMKDCGKDRTTIAGLMSEQLGSKVTVATLDAYASEAKDANNITVERFLALIRATGKTELLGFIAEDFDMSVVPSRYENVIKLVLIDEHQKAVDQHKKALQAKLRGAL